QATATDDDTFQNGAQERTLGTGGGGTADLFVVGADDHVGADAAAFEQCLQRHIAAEQVVQPRRRNELVVHADQRRRLGIIEAEFVTEDAAGPLYPALGLQPL